MFFNRFFESLMIAKHFGEISKPLKIFEITSNSCWIFAPGIVKAIVY